MSSVTQLLKCDQYGPIYADPADINFTTRFKASRSVKKVQGYALDNHTLEIIYNDGNNITIGSDTVLDALSVRLRLSGSDRSAARIRAIVAQMAAQIDDWLEENAFLGFAPTTLPINPA